MDCRVHKDEAIMIIRCLETSINSLINSIFKADQSTCWIAPLPYVVAVLSYSSDKVPKFAGFSLKNRIRFLISTTKVSF